MGDVNGPDELQAVPFVSQQRFMTLNSRLIPSEIDIDHAHSDSACSRSVLTRQNELNDGSRPTWVFARRSHRCERRDKRHRSRSVW